MLPYLVLGTAVLVVSTAALLIRFAMAEGVSPIAIAFWRMAIAGVALSLFVLTRKQGRREAASIAPANRWWIIGAGLFLALHIATWISSLAYTSVASSTALVTTNPVWLALFSWMFLKDKPDRWIWAGVLLSVSGSVLVFQSDGISSPTSTAAAPLLGNALALIGSLTVCGYLLIGRHINRLLPNLTVWTYVAGVYSIAAILLFGVCLATGQALTGYSVMAWAALIGLAVGPQILGHSGINWALKHFPPTIVATTILAEPVGSALLAWWLLNEPITGWQAFGFAFIVGGILLATQSQSRRSSQGG